MSKSVICWAPNGHDLVSWPAGRGLTPAWSEDAKRTPYSIEQMLISRRKRAQVSEDCPVEGVRIVRLGYGLVMQVPGQISAAQRKLLEAWWKRAASSYLATD